MPHTFLASFWPTMPCDTLRASKASSRPRPRMCECAPMRSILVRSLISEATLTLPPAIVPARYAETLVHHFLLKMRMHLPAFLPMLSSYRKYMKQSTRTSKTV